MSLEHTSMEYLNYLRVKKGLEAKYGEDPYETQKDYSLNKLAQIVEENIDINTIASMAKNVNFNRIVPFEEIKNRVI